MKTQQHCLLHPFMIAGVLLFGGSGGCKTHMVEECLAQTLLSEDDEIEGRAQPVANLLATLLEEQSIEVLWHGLDMSTPLVTMLRIESTETAALTGQECGIDIEQQVQVTLETPEFLTGSMQGEVILRSGDDQWTLHAQHLGTDWAGVEAAMIGELDKAERVEEFRIYARLPLVGSITEFRTTATAVRTDISIEMDDAMSSREIVLGSAGQ